MPTPDQAAGAASECVQSANARHEQPVLWLSAQALTHVRGFEEMTRAICQAKGINRFHVLFPPQGILDREPWREFYRTLPKSRIKP